MLLLLTVTTNAMADDITWVFIDDPGVPGHEGFTGHMSKYPATNGQYCAFLNAARASGDITVGVDNVVYGADGSNSGADFVGKVYFNTFAADPCSQITYDDDVFVVRNRDEYDMANHPVVHVSWYGATAFCNYYGYRLPTEWEWQAVADYNGSYTYGCGTTIDCAKANYNYCNPLGLSSEPFTSPVNQYPSYGHGMNDMAGHVWEWTSTVGKVEGKRILRGGTWYTTEYYCRVSYRGDSAPDDMYYSIGFRVVMVRTLHVDTINGDDTNNGLSRENAFAAIQKGIEVAQTGETVLVWPGVYVEDVDFLGKAITVRSAADAAHITKPGGIAVTFDSGEGPDTVLENMVVRDSTIAINCLAASPTIRNVTVGNNTQGIVAQSGAAPTITDSLLWDNASGDFVGCDPCDSINWAEDQTDHFVGAWGTDGYCIGVAVSPLNGYIYVTNRNTNRVEVFDANGNLQFSWGEAGTGDGQFSSPYGIALDMAGDVYVVDHFNERVQKFSPNGDFILEWGTYGRGDGQFIEPFGVCTDSTGNVYIVDEHNHRVQKFENDGTLIGWWGKDDLGQTGWHDLGSGREGRNGHGDGEFYYPIDIAVDRSGYVYVADADNHRVQKFTDSGSLIGWWGKDDAGYTGWHDPGTGRYGVSGAENGQFNVPKGIAVSAAGYVYVTCRDNRRAQQFTGDATCVGEWGEFGTGNGQFNSPVGIATDSSEYVYIADQMNSRIQKFFLPQFADPAAGDYHLKSERGRFYPEDPNQPGMFGDLDGLWAMDSVTSPCIDAGDPTLDPWAEPSPNGGRVNVGAYGNTPYASMSEWPLTHDSDRNGIVNLVDLAKLCQQWLTMMPWAN